MQQNSFGDIATLKVFVSGFLIKILYWIVNVVIVIGMFVSMSTLAYVPEFTAFNRPPTYSFSFGIALLILFSTIATLLIWRVVCEIWIVLFNIYDRLKQIEANTAG